jgi:hypothetical protein
MKKATQNACVNGFFVPLKRNYNLILLISNLKVTTATQMHKHCLSKCAKIIAISVGFVVVPTFAKAFTLIELLVVIASLGFLSPSNISCADDFEFSLILEEESCSSKSQAFQCFVLEFKPEFSEVLLSLTSVTDFTILAAALQTNITGTFTAELPRSQLIQEELINVSGKNLTILKTTYPVTLPPRKPDYIYFVYWEPIYSCGNGGVVQNFTPLSLLRYVPSNSLCNEQFGSIYEVDAQNLLTNIGIWTNFLTVGSISLTDLLSSPDGNKLLATIYNSSFQFNKSGAEYLNAITIFNPQDPSTHIRFFKNCTNYSPNVYKCYDCK